MNAAQPSGLSRTAIPSPSETDNLFAAPVLVLLLTACAARPYAAFAIENDAELVSNVVVSEASLQDVVRVGEALVERLPGGELHVVVPVRNIDYEAIQVLAQISFSDVDRRPVGDTSNNQVKLISPGGTVNMEWISRGREASDYVLRLSWYK